MVPSDRRCGLGREWLAHWGIVERRVEAGLDMENNMVEMRELRYLRGERLIFDGIEIEIPRGKITVIMGPSGSGKTTLLRLIGGQIRPLSGEVLFDGLSIPTLSRRELFEARKRMGMLFQSSALFTHLNVFDNVAFPIRRHTRLSNDLIRDLVLMKLNAVGLRGARDLSPGQLSGGMARRVALARSIALDPDMIMYDEPFTGQDPIAMGVVIDLIRGLNRALGLTSVVVSHDIQESLELADKVYVIADGHVIGSGRPEDLMREPTPRVRQFINGIPDGPVPFHYPAQSYREDILGGVN
jgi:phospholipid/cholesterol/gamma-HCH transport system ATP-binding protein